MGLRVNPHSCGHLTAVPEFGAFSRLPVARLPWLAHGSLLRGDWFPIIPTALALKIRACSRDWSSHAKHTLFEQHKTQPEGRRCLMLKLLKVKGSAALACFSGAAQDWKAALQSTHFCSPRMAYVQQAVPPAPPLEEH